MHSDHMPPPTPQELVSQLQDKYRNFLTACQELNQQQALKAGICGEWSAKAVVDHLTGWQIESLSILQRLLESDNPDLDFDIDAFNRTSVKDRKDLTWEESLLAFRLSFESYGKAMDEISVSHYRTNEAFKSWVKAMIREYEFHLPHIKRAKAA